MVLFLVLTLGSLSKRIEWYLTHPSPFSCNQLLKPWANTHNFGPKSATPLIFLDFRHALASFLTWMSSKWNGDHIRCLDYPIRCAVFLLAARKCQKARHTIRDFAINHRFRLFLWQLHLFLPSHSFPLLRQSQPYPTHPILHSGDQLPKPWANTYDFGPKCTVPSIFLGSHCAVASFFIWISLEQNNDHIGCLGHPTKCADFPLAAWKCQKARGTNWKFLR